MTLGAILQVLSICFSSQGLSLTNLELDELRDGLASQPQRSAYLPLSKCWNYKHMTLYGFLKLGPPCLHSEHSQLNSLLRAPKEC